MMRIVLALVVWLQFSVLGAISSAQEDAGDTSGYFMFLGAELRAEFRSRLLPVLSADRKGLYVDNVKGIKRVRYGARCALEPTVSLSTSIAQIEGLDLNFSNRAQTRRESQALAAMQSAANVSESNVARVNQNIEGVEADMASGVISREQGEAQIQNLEVESSDIQQSQQNLEDFTQDALAGGDFAPDGVNDTVHLKMDVVSSEDLANAYCAVVLKYVENTAIARLKEGPSVRVFIRKVGDLQAEIPQRVRFSASLGSEGVYNDAEVELYLFAGDGRPIATNLSRGLKMLTQAQLERLRELEG